MKFTFELHNDIIECRMKYGYFTFNICDIGTVLKYFKHRHKTSKRYYIPLYSSNFSNNKLYRELIFPRSYSGGCISKDEVEILINDLLEFKDGLEIDLDLSPMKVVRAIYKSKVGV